MGRAEGPDLIFHDRFEYEPAPDIIVEDAFSNPATVEIGEEVSVTAVLHNEGDADGEETVSLEVDGTVEESTTVTVEAPGEGESPPDTAVEATFDWSSDTSGEFDLSVNGVPAGTVTVLLPLLQGYEKVTSEVTLEAGGFQRELIECPEGKDALGGGATVINSGAGDFQTRIQESRPTESGWLIAISNHSATDRPIRMSAVCADPPEGFSLSNDDFTLQAGDFENNLVACESDGQLAFGGGLQVVGMGSGNFETRIEESSYVDFFGTPNWFVAASNQSENERSVRTSVVCSQPVRGYEIVTQEVEIDAESFARDIAECPDGSSIVGGGAALTAGASGSLGLRLQEAGPRAGEIYLASIANTSTTQRDVTITAICVNQP